MIITLQLMTDGCWKGGWGGGGAGGEGGGGSTGQLLCRSNQAQTVLSLTLQYVHSANTACTGVDNKVDPPRFAP